MIRQNWRTDSAFCSVDWILFSLETIAGDLSILLLIYLCSPLFNGLKICKAHSTEEVCTLADGMCGCAHIRQREKLLCMQWATSSQFFCIRGFFFFFLFPLFSQLEYFAEFSGSWFSVGSNRCGKGPHAHDQGITYQISTPPNKHLSYGWGWLVTGHDFRERLHKASHVKTKIMSFSVQGEVEKRIRGRQAGRVY